MHQPEGMTGSRVSRHDRPDGSIVLTSAEALGDYPGVLTDRLLHWAQTDPGRLFLAERGPDGQWLRLNYGEAAEKVLRLAQALVERGLSAERPVAVLSGNDINHALLLLAGQYVGAPVASVSPPYALVSTDYSKLRHVMATLTPGLVFVDDAAPFAEAIRQTVPADVEVVAAAGTLDRDVTPFGDLLSKPAGPQVAAARAGQAPDDVAKFLFTSGSTGLPKAVPNTHRMVCSNQQMIAQVLAPQLVEPPVLLDWLPWNHTFGGNQNLGLVIYNGGTLYIDDGRPVGKAFDRTLRNLQDVAPTMFFNVPKAFDELLPRLEQDSALAERFFSRLQLLFYAGAALPPRVWDGYPALARKLGRAPVLMTTSLGATETAPCSVAALHQAEQPGEIGVPAPGVELKLLPNGGKLELRIRGPNVMPGYWRAPELTAGAFDAEGFYMIGDAVRFVDEADLDRGLRFDGRIAEDFKLVTGTWVNVASVRIKTIQAFAPLARDVVIAGADRADLRALLVPDWDACRSVAGLEASASAADVAAAPALRQALASRLKDLAAQSTGSASRVVAISLLKEPLSLDAGEVTDKGSLNSRLILERRSDAVEALYCDDDAGTVTL